MQKPSADLDTAVAFVIERIGEEAERATAPLDDDEVDFLNHLPAQPTNPTAGLGFNTAYEYFWPTPVLRDFRFERLCRLAKSAHLHDLQTRPGAAREWGFAAAVLRLNRHPMSWLLQWAGIKLRKARGLLDGCLLLTTALLLVIVAVLGVLALSVLVGGHGEVWKRTLWIAGGCACRDPCSFVLRYPMARELAGKTHGREVSMSSACEESGKF
jgi:hypothetical protein